MKRKKKMLTAPEKLEQRSVELQQTEALTDQKLQEYFDRLADVETVNPEQRTKLTQEVGQEITALKDAAGVLRDTYVKTLAQADELETRLHDTERSRKKRAIIPPAPANATIDYEEKKTKHFAQGLNFYKQFYVCFIGSFLGVVIEILWCLINEGYIESRSGLVYGPFNLLYGFGAVALTAALYRFRNHTSLISFVGGALVGSAVEYACSWAQEMVFGSRSWDYSNQPFNLNGRICLLYSVFWGILGVFWIKNCYPRMAKWILKIPNRVGKIVAWVLLAFLVFDAAATVVTMLRWTERRQGVPAQNGFEQFVDRRFPDERMERVFANMVFAEE